MANERPNIIELLEQEKKYYLEQIKKTNIALSALKGEIVKSEIKKPSKNKTIRWTKTILKVLDEYDDLSLDELRSKVAEKGIPQALTEEYRNTIQSITHRLVRKGKLAKTEKGNFRKREKIIINEN